MNTKLFCRILGFLCFALALFFFISPKVSITGSVVGFPVYGGSSLVSLFFLVFGLGFVAVSDLENIVSYVKGVHPRTNHVSHSPLYNKITSKNISDVFQTPLPKKYGNHILGGKAIVYMRSSVGECKGCNLRCKDKCCVVFLTETTDTHHRHAAATVARIAEGISFEGPSYLNKKADALYGGDVLFSGELLRKCAGFELLYDLDKKKIIAVKQDSWLTKAQMRFRKILTKKDQEEMILSLLSNIDPRYLSDGLRNLDDEDIHNLYSGHVVR